MTVRDFAKLHFDWRFVAAGAVALAISSFSICTIFCLSMRKVWPARVGKRVACEATLRRVEREGA